MTCQRRKLKPPDPTWSYPHATRNQVEGAKRYLDTHKALPNWNIRPVGGQNAVLDQHRKNKIPWESVRPDLRPRCQEWFDTRIAKYKAEGRQITQGIINSVRCNATRQGRYCLTTRYSLDRLNWKHALKVWNRYLEWLAVEERLKFVASVGTETRLLDIA